MSGHGRPTQHSFARMRRGARARRLAAIAWLLTTVWCVERLPLAADEPNSGPFSAPRDTAASAPPAEASPRTEDAPLHDVWFVDRQHGWAVGDQGVIWHTADGGAHWQLQTSGVTCRLQSVQFMSPEIGWVAGSWPQPVGVGSEGVLLRTQDGGRTWTREKQHLPPLEQVRFLNPRDGWLVGYSPLVCPSGVMITRDGGKHWSPLPGQITSDWCTGRLFSPSEGLLAGRAGPVARWSAEGLAPCRLPALEGRRLAHLSFSTREEGWLVGDGGLILSSNDQGQSWQPPPGALPQGAAREFDWSACAVRGQRSWFVGTPGTRVLSTDDGGRSWQLTSTGCPLPLEAITFLDETHGWAVGALGTILATTDGGRSWRKQRSGGSRAAFVLVSAEAEQIGFEILARLSANEGYLGHVEVLGRREGEAGQLRDIESRTAAAVLSAGGSSAHVAWQFALPPEGVCHSAEDWVAHWDRVLAGRGLAEIERHLVRVLRVWRPDVVFAPAAGRQSSALDHFLHGALLRAVESAADPEQHLEQRAATGLEPWRVKKVYGVSAEGVAGDWQITATQLAPQLGKTLADVASPARALVCPVPAMGRWNLHLDVNHLPQSSQGPDGFSGIHLPPGGDARRRREIEATASPELLRQLAARQRNLQALMALADKDAALGARLQSQVGELVGDLPPDAAARLLGQLAHHAFAQGEWTRAAEFYELIPHHYSSTPQATLALEWLIRYWSSHEVAWRMRHEQHAWLAQQSVTVPLTNTPAGVQQAAAELNSPGVPVGALSASPAASKEISNDATSVASALLARERRAAEFARQLEQLAPARANASEVRFLCALIQVRQGNPREADRLFQSLRAGGTDTWAAGAHGERWLAERRGTAPRCVATARRVAERPRLDGRLDEAAWQEVVPLVLCGPSLTPAEHHAEVCITYDDEFLYLAVACTPSAGGDTSSPRVPRTHDADLASLDHVDLWLDMDRDFVTSYRLSIDCHGRTGDACWGDHHFNPTWYLAAAELPGVDGHGAWCAEAAIAWRELAPSAPTSGAAWGLAVVRTMPGAGYQNWSGTNTTCGVTEQFGYLVFEP